MSALSIISRNTTVYRYISTLNKLRTGASKRPTVYDKWPTGKEALLTRKQKPVVVGVCLHLLVRLVTF